MGSQLSILSSNIDSSAFYSACNYNGFCIGYSYYRAPFQGGGLPLEEFEGIPCRFLSLDDLRVVIEGGSSLLIMKIVYWKVKWLDESEMKDSGSPRHD